MNIEVCNLEKSFDGKKILHDINISVNSGEFVGIIGANGSGKSTLLKCIYRNLKQDSGTIFLENQELQKISIKDIAKKMAIVAQHNDTSFDFTVMEMVLLGRSPHKKFMERDNQQDYIIAKKALQKVGMSDFEDRNMSSLSGGEKQRIILARALVQDTKCLILDEPTNHLDIYYQLQFMNIAKKLNITIVSAIHDLNIAGMYCDKIYALKQGSIIAFGTPSEVLTQEIIKDLYGVNAKIIQDEDGLNIFFKKSNE